MKKLQKIQRYISFVPIISFFIILVVTVFELKRSKVKMIKWVHFMAIFFGTGIITAIFNEFLLSGRFPLLNFIVSWAILTYASILFVDLQCKCLSENVSVLEKEEMGHIYDVPKKSRSLEKNKKLWKVLFIVVIPLIFAISFILAKYYTGAKYHKEMTIADTNGVEDYSLNTLTQADVLSEASEYTMWKFGTSGEGQSSGVEDQFLKKFDNEIVHMSAKSFSGVSVAHATKCNADSLTLCIENQVENGNFAIVVLVDGVLFEELMANTNKEIFLTDVKGKTVVVKIAGESANFDIKVNRK